MRIEGTVLTVEHNVGKWTPPGATEESAFDNKVFELLVDNTIVTVKVPRDRQGLVADWVQGSVVEFEGKAPKGTAFSIIPPAAGELRSA